MVTTSSELQQVLDGSVPNQGVLYLANGNYHVSPGKGPRFTLKLASAETPYGARIHVHDAPLLLGHQSRLTDLTFIPEGDFGALRLDHATRSVIRGNHFVSRKQAGRVEHADEMEREGYGLVTTDDSISENNWRILIEHNNFQALRAGILIRPPGKSPIGDKVKGTCAWTISNNDFDGCYRGIRAARAHLFHITSNHIQLHHVGVDLVDSKSNWVRDNSFERGSEGRGAYDIRYGGDTCHMRTTDNTAPKERVSRRVYALAWNNEFTEFRKRNIYRPCAEQGGHE